MELHVSLSERTNLSGEIYRQLRQSILDGRLQAGDRLPPVGISRAVQAAPDNVSLPLEPAGAGHHRTRAARTRR
jgi:GntR family transcriptional regulator / MocR family aminotransferase